LLWNCPVQREHSHGVHQESEPAHLDIETVERDEKKVPGGTSKPRPGQKRERKRNAQRNATISPDPQAKPIVPSQGLYGGVREVFACA
jgi:hypothetical protein